MLGEQGRATGLRENGMVHNEDKRSHWFPPRVLGLGISKTSPKSGAFAGCRPIPIVYCPSVYLLLGQKPCLFAAALQHLQSYLTNPHASRPQF